MIKIYLVEDEYYVRTSIKINTPWQQNGFVVVGEANNGKKAYEDILELCPDICIVDINIPILNGLELIKKVRENNIRAHFIILTGYSEFKYAQQAIELGVSNYILKPINYNSLMTALLAIKDKIDSTNKEIISQIQIKNEYNQLLINKYYNDLVFCNLTTYSTIEQSKMLDISNQIISFNSYRIILFHFSNNPDFNNFTKIISNFLNTSLFYPCTTYDGRYYIIIDDYHISDINQLIINLNNTSSAPKFQYGIGNPSENLECIYQSYNEAYISLKHAILYNKQYCCYNDISSVKYTSINTTKKFLLKTAIYEKNYDDIRKIVTEIFNDYKEMNYSNDNLVFSAIELVNLLIDTLSTKLERPVSLFTNTDNIMEELQSIKSVDAFIDWVYNYYSDYINKLLSDNKTVCSVTNQIINYIKNNYSNSELTINTIASELFLNYSYLCLCFKRDTSTTINEYLLKYRIEQSKLLLENLNNNICYIAEKCGFNSPAYFTKKFKSITGITPSEYIKTIK